MQRTRRVLAEPLLASFRDHAEFGVLAVLLACSFALPKGLPLGISALGLVGGAPVALQAIAVVLVYRSNRIINFAQLQIAAVAATLFGELAYRRTFLMGIHVVCGSCVKVSSVQVANEHFALPVGVAGWLLQLNFWLSVVTALLAAVLLEMVLFAAVHLRRFADAPRLVVTVFTIGAGQAFAMLSVLLLYAFHDKAGAALAIPAGFPFRWSTTVGGVTFVTSDILAVVLLGAFVAFLVGYLRRSATGVMLRGSADNPARAQTLGVNTAAVSARAWLIAGVIAGVTAVLGATASSAAGGVSLVPVLTAAVVGGLVGLPAAVVGALVIGVIAHAALWSYNTTAAVDGVSLLVVVVVLLAQRSRPRRSDAGGDGWTQSVELRPIPAELRGLDVVVRWQRTGLFLVVAAVLALPWILSPSQTTLTDVVVLYAVVGLSLLVLTGWAGQISLGQLGIAAVGAYITAKLQLPFPLPVVVGGLAGSVAALVVGLPALRLRGLHLAITTLAFNAAVISLLVDPAELGRYLPQYLARPNLVGLNLNDDRTFYYVTLVVLVLALVATLGMRRSRTGRALIASRENEALAQSFGINLTRARLSAFMISGFMAAVAGGMYAYAAYGVGVSDFGIGQSTNVFVLVVIGGLGTTLGPLLGAVYIGATTVFSSNQLLSLGATGLGLVAVMLFAPGGLSQLAYTVRDMMLRRVADRYKIDVPSLFADRASRRYVQAPIAPKTRSGGGAVFVPERYRPPGQWAVSMLQRERADG
ncbi:MAG TPA: ABC transporter permease [Mycobacteriales bacterium]|nr:ABC transporter permease [Mycobacteriales bacterium]